MSSTTMLHVRVEDNLKKEATIALKAMGLSLSEVVRILLTRIADEQKIPSSLLVPNAETRQAMEEARVISNARFKNQQDLFNALNH